MLPAAPNAPAVSPPPGFRTPENLRARRAGVGVQVGTVSGLTAAMMLDYLGHPATPGNIRQAARQLGVNGNGESVTLETPLPLSEETAARNDKSVALVAALPPYCRLALLRHGPFCHPALSVTLSAAKGLRR